ncbi:MAG: hypothetical protein LUO93_00295 [Methanomicrobiales archaeon]|nr:hypothetical protein [Methanomicrobiales archaeon]
MVTLVLSNEDQCEAYTSDEMIPLLRNLSSSFGMFLSREGRTLLWGKPIYWISTETAPESIVLHDTENAHVVEDNSSVIIVLKRLPAEEKDVYVAAHELGHVLLEREGFPIPKRLPGNVSLAFSLYAMLQDPLINVRLSRYGFDAIAHYTSNVHTSLAVLADKTPPFDFLDRLLWCCNIVGIMLDGEYSQAAVIRQQFEESMFGRFPDLVPEITQLYSLVREIGFDTPEQQRKLLQGIAKKYHLYEVPEEA